MQGKKGDGGIKSHGPYILFGNLHFKCTILPVQYSNRKPTRMESSSSEHITVRQKSQFDNFSLSKFT